MIATQDIDRIIGSEAVDPQNDKIGKVSQVYIDQDTEQPRWVSVRTGLFGTSESLIPLDNANWDSEALHVGYDKARVKDAPRVDADRELSTEEQEQLYDYYGLTDATGGFGGSGMTGGADTTGFADTTATGTGMTGEDDFAGTTTGRAGVGTGTGRDTMGRDTGPRHHGPRHGRLRHVGPDHRRRDDPLRGAAARRHREVSPAACGCGSTSSPSSRPSPSRSPARRSGVEREPITDANRGDAMDGPAISEEEHEVVLTEEARSSRRRPCPWSGSGLEEEVTRTSSVSETSVRRRSTSTATARPAAPSDTALGRHRPRGAGLRGSPAPLHARCTGSHPYSRGVRLNGLGVAMYLLMTGWLLFASIGRLMIELSADQVDWLPFVGIALGALALGGIGLGRVVDDGRDRGRERGQRRPVR